MLHFVFRFIEGLGPEIGQIIKSHLIFWQAKPIDEVLQYAKYCSDETELKQKKLKEKARLMQIKAAQNGLQGALVQHIPQQQETVMFQPQARGRGCGINMKRGPDLNTVAVQNDVQGMKKMLLCHLCGNGTVQENVRDLTVKEVGLIKGVEPIKITLKPNVVFPQLSQYNMAQDVLMKVAQITGDFLKQGVLKEVLSIPCNSPIMGLKKPCGKV
ncbi:hypothetical protein NDU88_004509 [Pleurodeles waltl]|uniref:Uncharacterized protein n=1 Tax=Pleurodeles waltl TaxID=8319 RepID=A0AAV7T8Z6_PLEWA|nr:hypothetical protein NDU88_004509 [Pleurodeles waltl]